MQSIHEFKKELALKWKRPMVMAWPDLGHHKFVQCSEMLLSDFIRLW